jgi:hypothetical protein
MKSLSLATIALGAVAALAPAAQVSAEVFILRGGGRVEGMLVPSSESPRERYVIKLASGDQITLTRDQVKEVHKSNSNLQEYQKHRPTKKDTAEDQWILAEWCNSHKLPAERILHMERVIELDPNHAKARAALGYVKEGGAWQTRDEIQRKKGLVKDRTGKWRPPQQIEDLEREKKTKEAEKAWIVKIKRWRGWLDGDRAQEATTEIQQIDDPMATAALINYMKNEGDAGIRRLFVDALIRLQTPDAIHALGNYAMDDPDEEVRASCLDYLAKSEHPGCVDFFIKRLRHKDNVIVNRAGYALGKMKDQRAVRPLIDALVTTHQFQIQPANPGNMNAGFSGNGGMSFGGGGGGPQIISKDLPNSDVHTALTEMTHVNFDYDQRAWKAWLSSQKKTADVDARRD